MGQKEKLIKKLKSRPKDFTFDEAETLLKYLTCSRSDKGRTGGSRVMFVSNEYAPILLHKPHPRKELVDDFHGAVDDYLELCEAQGIEPERAYKGSFNVRISPELHKQAAICAAARKISLNSLVETALRNSLASLI